MDRRNFIKKSCTACLSLTVVSALESCVSTQFITGNLVKDGITLKKEDFMIQQKGSKTYTSFLILRNEALKYPICVYRLNDQEYTALWMRCTHQGTELQASGDVLQCSAHGSEFSNKGEVRSGPADTALRKFPISITNDEIFIDLRKPS